MKIVILNGSPLKNGNTKKICDHLFENSNAKIITYYAYYSDIRACTACEYCFRHENVCVIKDEFQQMMSDIDDCDLVVLASPLHFSCYSGKLLAMLSRMQYIFALIYVHKKPVPFKNKKALTIVNGGNDYKDMFDAIKPIDRMLYDHMNVKEVKKLLIRDTDDRSIDEIFEFYKDEMEVIKEYIKTPYKA